MTAYLKENSKVEFMLIDTDRRRDMTKLLEKIKRKFIDEAREDPETKFKMMVAGMPNVGKSTVINRLRAIGTSIGGKAAKTGGLPGITRSVSEMIRISQMPKIYLHDTPGVMMPKIFDPEVGLKVALTGGMLDRVVGDYLLAEYLLHILVTTKNKKYLRKYNIPGNITDISVFLPILAQKIHQILPSGAPNVHNAIAIFLKHFRQGEFGGITLDKIPTTINKNLL